MNEIVWLDFEAYSELDITEVGTIRYVQHESTERLCMSWRTDTEHGFWVAEDIPNGPEEFVPLRRLFNKPSLTRLFKILSNTNVLVEAHNAMLERMLWNWHCVFYDDWPEIAFERWRCSAAKAAACALPRGLGDLGRALGLDVVKDEETGSRLMSKLTRPGKDGKRQKASKEEWEEFYQYCEQDTAAERAASKAIPDLLPTELRVWQMDQRTNHRGFRVDVDGARHAIRLAEAWTDERNAELRTICASSAEGENAKKTTVERATQRDRLKAWLAAQGVHMPNMQANTIDAAVLQAPPGPAKNALVILRSIGRSSISKYAKLMECQHAGRLFDTMKYHGAATGRWTAEKFQPHNTPRGKIKDMPGAWEDIKTLLIDELRAKHGDPMTLLSHAVRGVIIPDEDYMLHCGDYSAIETRVNFWFAGELEGLEMFARGEDVYCDMASDIYARTITKAMADANKEDAEARQLGKQSILGLGFQMFYIKFLITCRTYKMKFTTEVIRKIVPAEEIIRLKMEITKKEEWERCLDMGMTQKDIPELILMRFVAERYRTRYANTVVALWAAIEEAAKLAVKNPGKSYSAGKIGKVRFYLKQSGGFTRKWDRTIDKLDGFGIKGGFVKKPLDFLCAELPSGRRLFYPDPEIETTEVKYKDRSGQERTRTRETLSFMGVDQKTHQWVREDTYGGKLCFTSDTKVLTCLGWKAIVDVESSDLLWDGSTWVPHGGLIYQGRRNTLRLNGIGMTPGQEVLTNDGWKTASSSEGYNRAPCGLPSCGEIPWQQWETVPLVNSLRLWKRHYTQRNRAQEAIQTQNCFFLWLQAQRNHWQKESTARNDQASGAYRLAEYVGPLQAAYSSSLEELWWPGNFRLFSLAALHELLEGYGQQLSTWLNNRTQRQQRQLQQGQLLLGNNESPSEQSTQKHLDSDSARQNDNCGRRATFRNQSNYAPLSITALGRSRENVFDLMNVGPQNRFVVRDEDGSPLIVHNCNNVVQGTARDYMAEAKVRTESSPFQLLLSIHDELITQSKIIDVPAFNRLISESPIWAAGLPVKADCWAGVRYYKK